MSSEETTDICLKSLGVGWWCVKPYGHAPPCHDDAAPTVAALEAKVAAMNVELEALRAVESAALAYVPYPAKTFDERHSPLREALIHALAKVAKVRDVAAKGKAST